MQAVGISHSVARPPKCPVSESAAEVNSSKCNNATGCIPVMIRVKLTARRKLGVVRNVAIDCRGVRETECAAAAAGETRSGAE